MEPQELIHKILDQMDINTYSQTIYNHVLIDKTREYFFQRKGREAIERNVWNKVTDSWTWCNCGKRYNFDHLVVDWLNERFKELPDEYRTKAKQRLRDYVESLSDD